jgi:Ca-activated chloride channel family protein
VIVSLARPREGQQQTIIESEGIAIQMVVDRSGSMQAMDFQIDGEHVDRLTAVKNVAGKFVSGGGELLGRYSDLIGLISFAGFADAITPPTLDHGFLLNALNQTEIVNQQSEDGTAIGDAIALAVEKLNSLDAKQDEKVKSKIIILLTDGENTAGEFLPVEAAEIAQAVGIKIYTIGIGTKGQAPFPVIDPFSGRKMIRWMQVNVDEATLKEVAKKTAGKFFRATDTDTLENVYREIDQLEKSKVETNHFVDFTELAVQPFRMGSWQLPPLLMAAFACLWLRVLLQQTWLREFA